MNPPRVLPGTLVVGTPTLWLGLIAAGLASATLAQPMTPLVESRTSYLLLVDTSYSMRHEAVTERNLVYDLVRSGFNGTMRAGDVFAIWTFSDQVYSDRFRAQSWLPELNQAFANRAYNFLRRERWEHRRRLDRAMAALGQLVRKTDPLVVVLISAGDDTIRGTPFDRELNEYYESHVREWSKARKPFVTILVGRGGQWASWTVNAAGDSIRIPNRAETLATMPPPQSPPPPTTPKPETRVTTAPAPASPTNQTHLNPATAATTPKETAPPRAVVKETPAPTPAPPSAQAPAPAPAPGPPPPTNTPLTATASSTKPSAKPPAQATPGPIETPKPPPVFPPTSPPPAIAISSAKSTPPGVVSPLPQDRPPAEVRTPSAKPNSGEGQRPAPAPLHVVESGKGSPTLTNRAVTNVGSETAGLALSSPPRKGRVFLVLGIGLALLALGLIGFMIRRGHARPGATFITRSFDTRNK